MEMYVCHLHKSTGNRWALTFPVLNPGSTYHNFLYWLNKFYTQSGKQQWKWGKT